MKGFVAAGWSCAVLLSFAASLVASEPASALKPENAAWRLPLPQGGEIAVHAVSGEVAGEKRWWLPSGMTCKPLADWEPTLPANEDVRVLGVLVTGSPPSILEEHWSHDFELGGLVLSPVREERRSSASPASNVPVPSGSRLTLFHCEIPKKERTLAVSFHGPAGDWKTAGPVNSLLGPEADGEVVSVLGYRSHEWVYALSYRDKSADFLQSQLQLRVAVIRDDEIRTTSRAVQLSQRRHERTVMMVLPVAGHDGSSPAGDENGRDVAPGRRYEDSDHFVQWRPLRTNRLEGVALFPDGAAPPSAR